MLRIPISRQINVSSFLNVFNKSFLLNDQMSFYDISLKYVLSVKVMKRHCKRILCKSFFNNLSVEGSPKSINYKSRIK